MMVSWKQPVNLYVRVLRLSLSQECISAARHQSLSWAVSIERLQAIPEYICSWVGFFAGVLGAALYRGTQEPQVAPNQQTGLRLACNLCKHLPLRQWMQTHNAALMDRFAPCCSSTNKSVRFAFATFMLNLSVFFSTTAKADAEGQAQVGLLDLLQLCCILIQYYVFRCVSAAAFAILRSLQSTAWLPSCNEVLYTCWPCWQM